MMKREQTDQGLVPQAEAVESKLSFDELYERYATDVLRMSYYYLGDRQRAEDVCQDVFVRLLTNKPRLTEGSEKGWLLRVTVNRCRDLWRSAWLKRVTLGSPGFEILPGEDDVANTVQKQVLVQSIGKLPAQFKQIILLHYYQGMAINEIAELLELPQGTVASRLSRGRKKLEVILKEDEAQ